MTRRQLAALHEISVVNEVKSGARCASTFPAARRLAFWQSGEFYADPALGHSNDVL
jgi:hypothetical protein